MSEFILSAEPVIRLSVFLGVLAAMAFWEVGALRHRRDVLCISTKEPAE